MYGTIIQVRFPKLVPKFIWSHERIYSRQVNMQLPASVCIWKFGWSLDSLDACLLIFVNMVHVCRQVWNLHLKYLWASELKNYLAAMNVVMLCFKISTNKTLRIKAILFSIESVSAERLGKILKSGFRHCCNTIWSLTINSEEPIRIILEYVDIETLLIALESILQVRRFSCHTREIAISFDLAMKFN